MPRRCTICTHPDREAIDAALVAGGPLRDIAGQFRISKSALARHKGSHIPACLAKAQDAHEIAQADSLLAQVRDLQAKALRILARAERAGELRTALAAIREARGNIELLGKLAGELLQEGTVTIVTHPDWLRLRVLILATLEPFPAVRALLVQRLSENDGH